MIDSLKAWLTLWLDNRAVTAWEGGIIAGGIVALNTIGFTTVVGSLSTKFVRAECKSCCAVCSAARRATSAVVAVP
jgi:hypothetical protein